MTLQADALRSASRQLQGCDIPTWHGPAAIAYRLVLDDDIRDLSTAARDVDDLAAALGLHAAAVEESPLEKVVESPGVLLAGVKAALPWTS